VDRSVLIKLIEKSVAEMRKRSL